jgi:predicted nicotinamide N-methyase
LLSTAQEREYVTYHLSLLSAASTPPQITLLERRSVVSAGGTTGFRTWESALHLGQFLCSDPFIIAGKRVLELGAGTGYLSVLCAQHLNAAQVIASDGSDDVINNMPDNLFLNGLQGSKKIRPMDLKWGHAIVGTEEESWNGGEPLDVVLGADITYDRSVIPALLGTLQELVDMFPGVNILVAAIQRNKETFEFFLGACVGAGLVVTAVPYEVPRWSEQMGPFYDDSVPIHICRLSKR